MDENMKLSQNLWLKPTEGGFNTNESQPPPPSHQNCPRCYSSNTKFCYYNNYSIAQPRYFCKSCRRYWTHGGALRNVPIGGSARKNKRGRASSGPSSSSEVTQIDAAPPPPAAPVLVQGQGLIPVDIGTHNSLYPGAALLSSLTTFQSFNQPPIGSSSNSGRFGANMSVLQGVNFSSISPQAPALQFNTEYVPTQRGLMRTWGSGLVHKEDSTNTLYGGRGSFWSNTMVDDVDRQLNPNYSVDKAAHKHSEFGPSE